MAIFEYDFSEAVEFTDYNPRNVEEGEYLLTIKSADIGESKGGNAQVIFVFTAQGVKGATYPYYTPLNGKGSGRLRQLVNAIGAQVKTRGRMDTSKFVGKTVGGLLLDDEYQGEIRSKVSSTFPASKLLEDSDTEPDEVDEEEEETAPRPRFRKAPAKKTAPKRAPVEEEETLDLEGLEEEEL